MEPLFDNVFRAERILKRKRFRGRFKYLVKWQGYSKKDCTWEPEDNILDQQLIDDFIARMYQKQIFVKDMKARLRHSPKVCEEYSTIAETNAHSKPGNCYTRNVFLGLNDQDCSTCIPHSVSSILKMEEDLDGIEEPRTLPPLSLKREHDSNNYRIVSCKNAFTNSMLSPKIYVKTPETKNDDHCEVKISLIKAGQPSNPSLVTDKIGSKMYANNIEHKCVDDITKITAKCEDFSYYPDNNVSEVMTTSASSFSALSTKEVEVTGTNDCSKFNPNDFKHPVACAKEKIIDDKYALRKEINVSLNLSAVQQKTVKIILPGGYSSNTSYILPISPPPSVCSRHDSTENLLMEEEFTKAKKEIDDENYIIQHTKNPKTNSEAQKQHLQQRSTINPSSWTDNKVSNNQHNQYSIESILKTSPKRFNHNTLEKTFYPYTTISACCHAIKPSCLNQSCRNEKCYACPSKNFNASSYPRNVRNFSVIKCPRQSENVTPISKDELPTRSRFFIKLSDHKIINPYFFKDIPAINFI